MHGFIVGDFFDFFIPGAYLFVDLFDELPNFIHVKLVEVPGVPVKAEGEVYGALVKEPSGGESFSVASRSSPFFGRSIIWGSSSLAI